jgi:hypothetical protein
MENLSMRKRLKLVEKLFDLIAMFAVIENSLFETGSPHIITNVTHLAKQLIVKFIKNDCVLVLDRDTIALIEQLNSLTKQNNDKKCKCKCSRNIATDTDCSTSVDSSF